MVAIGDKAQKTMWQETQELCAQAEEMKAMADEVLARSQLTIAKANQLLAKYGGGRHAGVVRDSTRANAKVPHGP